MALENIPAVYMQFDNTLTHTVVMVDGKTIAGFYTWNKQYERIALIHFLVARAFRVQKSIRCLIRHFMKTLKQEGINKILVGIPDNNVSLFKFVKYYFNNVQPYSIQNRTMFVQAEV